VSPSFDFFFFSLFFSVSVHVPLARLCITDNLRLMASQPLNYEYLDIDISCPIAVHRYPLSSVLHHCHALLAHLGLVNHATGQTGRSHFSASPGFGQHVIFICPASVIRPSPPNAASISSPTCLLSSASPYGSDVCHTTLSSPIGSRTR
jgi:hypothetical protein